MNQESNPKKSGFDFQWLFAFSIVFGGFYLMTKPATNNSVLVFRISVVAFGVIGLLVTTLIKHHRAKSV